MNDTNTNKADDMNEDDVTLTGPEGENTAVESDAAADATADTATESPDAAGASDSTTVPDSVQFSIVFDDDGDDSDAIVIDAADAEIDTTAEADTTVATDGSAEEAPADDENPGDDTQDAAAQEPASADNTADNTSADTGDAEVLDQNFRHIGREEARKRRAEMNVLHAEVKKSEKHDDRLLLIPRNNQRQRQAVYICIKRIGKCYGNTDCGVNIVALTDVE